MLRFLPIVLLFGLFISNSGFAQDVTPGTNENGTLFLQVANTYFEVDPSFGAHISAFSIDGENIIFGNKVDNGYLWGATLWQSPQSEWNWPPSVALDQDPYAGGVVDNTIDLLSDEDYNYDTHLTFRKVFTASTADTSVNISYTLNNNGDEAHSYSAWELTRVASGGMAFFPYGEGSITGNFATYVEKINEIAWYKYATNQPSGRKYFSDGAEGWDAWLSDSGLLYIRKFENADANAPGEKEIELWFNGHDSYIELELQSAYTEIAANSSFTWNVKWYLRKVPANLNVDKGSGQLVNYVRNIVNRTFSVPEGELALNRLYNVFPNPADDFVSIKPVNENTAIAQLKIYSSTGSLIKSTGITGGTEIDLTDMCQGLYMYVISINDAIIQTGKFLVKK